MNFPSEFSARGRTTDAPVAMEIDGRHSVPPPAVNATLAALATKLKIPQQWVGMSGYLVAGVFLGLVLIAALSLGGSDANASMPPPAPNATLDNVVHLHAREIGDTCWAGLETSAMARLTVALEVGIDGKIRYAAASGATTLMRECIQTHVKSWEFLPQAQPQTMALPFEVDRR